MNQLNSLIIEGMLVDDPALSVINASKFCTFRIETHRYYKQDDEQVKETSTFPVEACGPLGDLCYDNLTSGRGVRVVGRLKSVDDKIVIIAEHVDFKPVRDV